MERKIFITMFIAMIVGCLVIIGMNYIGTDIYYKQRAKYPNAVVVDKYVRGGRISDPIIVLDLDGDLSTADKRSFRVSYSVYDNTLLDN